MAEFILEARATPTLYREAQDRGLALLGRNRRDARGSGGGEVNIGHGA